MDTTKTRYQCNTCGTTVSGTSAAYLHKNTEHPSPGLQPLHEASIKLVAIPHHSFQRGATDSTGIPSLIPPDKTKGPEYSHIVQFGNDGPGNRKMVVVNHNGVHVPFYLSSGAAGKDDPSLPPEKRVAAGKWYPHFGIGRPSLLSFGWINKGNTDQIQHHYGSPELAHIASLLDKHIGDIRESKDHPIVSGIGPERDFINSHMPEEPSQTNGHPEGLDRFDRNVLHITRALEESRRQGA